MLNKNNALITAGVIFAIVAVLHLSRLATKFQVVVGGYEIPIWANVGGSLVAGLLAIWMFAAAKTK